MQLKKKKELNAKAEAWKMSLLVLSKEEFETSKCRRIFFNAFKNVLKWVIKRSFSALFL